MHSHGEFGGRDMWLGLSCWQAAPAQQKPWFWVSCIADTPWLGQARQLKPSRMLCCELQSSHHHITFHQKEPQGRGDVLTVPHLTEALACSGESAWVWPLPCPCSVRVCSPHPHLQLPLPNRNSFSCDPLAFSRKCFELCKQDIDFYITCPTRL